MKSAVKLYLIHFFAIIAVWLGTYYPGWDVVLSVLYIVIITYQTICSAVNYQLINKIMLVFVSQVIPLILSIITIGQSSSDAVFLLELWYTPLLPLLSFVDIPGPYYSMYYYILLAMPLLMLVYLWLALQIISLIKCKYYAGEYKTGGGF